MADKRTIRQPGESGAKWGDCPLFEKAAHDGRMTPLARIIIAATSVVAVGVSGVLWGHLESKGHAVMVERVDNLIIDLKEIRSEIGICEDHIGALREGQAEIIGILRDNDH